MEPLKRANIRLRWEGLPGTKTLAYYEDLSITAVKSCVTLGPGAVVTTFTVFVQISHSVALHWLKRLSRDKHSSLSGRLISYKENEVL